MFQISRSLSNDFVISDVIDAQNPLSISRFACRIIANRDDPSDVSIYASCFDKSSDLVTSATNWKTDDGYLDSLAKNGVLIRKSTKSNSLPNWSEVSVNGEMFKVREDRSNPICNREVSGRTNRLGSFALIDLCGVTLMWRSAKVLETQISACKSQMLLNELNSKKAGCPVSLNKLIFANENHDSDAELAYVYFPCGHVQGNHQWKLNNREQNNYSCPICRVEPTYISQVKVGAQLVFHMNDKPLEYAFNPCGHLVSKATAIGWSRILMPEGPRHCVSKCPFCMQALDVNKPYVKLMLQEIDYQSIV